MADAIHVEVVAFEAGPDAHHVVEVEQGGVRRRVVVRVDDGAWQGLGWFRSAPDEAVRHIVVRYVQLQASAGALKDQEFIGNDEAADIHWGRK